MESQKEKEMKKMKLYRLLVLLNLKLGKIWQMSIYQLMWRHKQIRQHSDSEIKEYQMECWYGKLDLELRQG